MPKHDWQLSVSRHVLVSAFRALRWKMMASADHVVYPFTCEHLVPYLATDSKILIHMPLTQPSLAWVLIIWIDVTK